MLWKLLRSALGPGPKRLVNRGLGLRKQGRLPEAEKVLRLAVEKFPRSAVAATNLGIVLLEQDQGQQGVDFLQRALQLDQRCAPAHFNLANVLRSQGRLGEAVAHYRAAKFCDPQLACASEELMHSLLEVCDWDAAQVEADELRALVKQQPPSDWLERISPLTAAYLELDPEQRKQVAVYHAAQPALGVKPARSHPMPDMSSGARLRIGYLSRDFRDHPVGHLLRNAFALHDRGRFEVYAFSFGPDDGSIYRGSIAAGVDHFVDVARSTDEQIADAIAAAGIHLLIDLMGHTTGNRLGVLARRPAPVQAHYLGYPGTTGAAYIDYFITDRIATPPELAAEFTEQVAYVPRCFMVSDASAQRPASTTRAQQGLPEDAYVFCNFANSSRITREVFRIWMDILRAVPSGVLWLKNSHALTVHNLRRHTQGCGIDPDRLVFAKRVADKSAHLARLALADLALDTIGWYNGHSSTADVLWAGVPVLTVAGTTFASRVAVSLLHASGLSGLAVRDAGEYAATAIRLGNDLPSSSRFKQALAGSKNSAPFFDPGQIVRDLEAAYLEMRPRATSSGTASQSAAALDA